MSEWYVSVGGGQEGPMSEAPVPGIKTAIFGGEGLFFASLTGPGRVWLQSLPFSRLAGRVLSAVPRGAKGRKGEGSVLGDLGEMLMGD